MRRIRNGLADLIVGVAVIAVAFWLLRVVFRMFLWGVSLIVLVLVVALALRIAAKIRG